MGVLLYGSHLVAGLGLAVLGSTCPSSRASVTNLSAAPPSHHEHMRGPTGLTNLYTLSCMCNASKPPPRWPESSDVNYELELVVALNKGGSNIKEEDAYDHIYGFGIGLDMTRRDLQGVCKKMGRPWEIGKAFERSAPMGSLTPMSEVGKMESGSIQLKVNDEVRQDGDLDMMLWKIPEQIAILSKFYDITAGDLIMTGTPAGVGPIVKGDKLVGTIDGLQTLSVEVV